MRLFLLAILLKASTLVGFAQDDIGNKLSISTQMFLSELVGDVSFDQTKELIEARAKAKGISLAEATKQAKYDRPIVKAVDMNGRQFISAFVRVSDRSVISQLEALGVEVQCEFSNGTLFTTMIPVDKLMDVAQMAKVTKISVATKRRPLTDKARQGTNVDDVLTLSTDAIRAGLSNKYDGSGVLLGVIDTGIDFQHKAFKDKDGNTRIKRAYVVTATTSWSGSTSYSEKEYGDGASNSITSSAPTTDDSSEDHGTHTSSTAGGSSVIISGSTTTVTDDHASATYGGMAPGADLYLAGCDLSDTYLANSFQKICNYADSKGMPVVVSNSWGGQFGPHDGTGEFADICAQYFSDSNPNHICLFAASNDAGTNGFHVMGNASSSSPLGTVMNWNTDYGLTFYYGIIANAWTRSSDKTLGCKVIVINSSGAKQAEVTVSASTNGTAVSGLSNYISSGTLYAYKDYVSSNKSQILLYAAGTNSSPYLKMKSGYKLAVQFYPTSGSDVIDIWSGSAYTYYTNTPSTSGYTWTKGSDDMCVSDEATIPNAISIGAYSTKNKVTDYNNTSHTLSDFTVGDIAYFSSYATADQSPTGIAYPWICAPGATVVSGVNAYDTSGDFSYINGNSAEYDMYRVNKDTTNPYGSMEGTSMATPCAAGIVALWLQAAKEVGKQLTTSDVKQIMQETAITDSYTNGANASHFGNGKIDALAGIKYILGATSNPTISVDQEEVAFEGYATKEYTKTITVTGINLKGNITVSKSGSIVFSLNKNSITQTDGSVSTELTITWKPTTAGTQIGTITLSSTEAESVTINLTGTAEAATPTIVTDKQSVEFSALLDKDVTQTINVSGRFLTGNITATLTDANGVFTVDKTNFETTEDGVAVTITFHSVAEGTFAGTLVLTSAGASSVSISLSATAREGGTASDSFLNIAKYETIDEAGWNTTYVNTLYKYTRYEDDEVAWLTMPVYGAYASKAFDPKSQNWISFNGTGYSGTTWNAADIFPGSGDYFTSATARSYGNTGSLSEQTVSFYITNVTGAKLYGKNTKNVSANYPTSLKVYECTMNVDGTLTATNDDVKSAQNTTASAIVNIEVTELDVSKIYKVDASICQGYLYEIGFQTPIEVEKIPTIKAEPTELTFEPIYATTEVTQTINVSGKYLENDITIRLNDDNEAFTVDRTSIATTDAVGGVELAVTFHPDEAGEYNATITLSSENAEDVVISLSGTAEAAISTIIADPTSLTFTSNIDTPISKTISVTGRFLEEDVTVTLADANNVFSVSSTTLLAEDVNTNGVEMIVTFNSANEGDFTGTLTLTSEGAEPVTITLSASANDGGTASDVYLNIAKYTTIDDAGWNTSLVDKLYKYTEYEEDEVAWLTLPVYGAFVGAKYLPTNSTFGSGRPQKWIESNVPDISTTRYTGITWSNSDEFLGSSPYFTSTSARAMGYNSRRNTTLETVTFYVTNTTAVKMLGIGQSRTESSYPTTLNIYECTVNADGTVTASSTTTSSESNSASSGDFVLTATNLDASKIYKVETATYRSYICEIAFQTPLKKKLIGDVNRDGNVTIADVTAIVNITIGNATDYNNYDIEAANVNGDNVIDTADVMELINIILGK